MKTVNLQIYADPDVLREFSPRMLVALMDEHRPFWNVKNLVNICEQKPVAAGEDDRIMSG